MIKFIKNKLIDSNTNNFSIKKANKEVLTKELSVASCLTWV